MPGDASALHCPNCGAPAEPDARRCPYCEARLATVACPSCFGLMFEGAAYCPRCGAARARGQTEEEDARCPGCRQAMQRTRVGGTALLECAACDGIWMDASVFERLCADREAQAAVLHQFPERAPGATPGRIQYRPCARCARMMNRVNFGRISGTVVDVCRGHGTYLDAGELHRIVAFIQSGGLDRARERQLEELREQERRLNAAQAKLARDRGRANPQASLRDWSSWVFMIGD